VFVLVSLVTFIVIVYFVTLGHEYRPHKATVAAVAVLVVVGGMVFAKFGNNAGLPWWIYYTVSALVTFALPPALFKFSDRELTQYLNLAARSSRVIHVTFSFLFNWHEYMPFIPVPSLRSQPDAPGPTALISPAHSSPGIAETPSAADIGQEPAPTPPGSTPPPSPAPQHHHPTDQPVPQPAANQC
jgi:hypothetical protein